MVTILLADKFKIKVVETNWLCFSLAGRYF